LQEVPESPLRDSNLDPLLTLAGEGYRLELVLPPQNSRTLALIGIHDLLHVQDDCEGAGEARAVDGLAGVGASGEADP
jgi:hypothetical protein